MIAPTGPEHGFGLYVHWPYCARICPYCDFNVYAAKNREAGPLVDAICEDILAHGVMLPSHPSLDAVFLGGGTPSLMAPGDVERVLEAAEATFGFSPKVEITLEANPNDVLRGDLAAWRAAGINRLSIGVQSLDDTALGFLGRDHGADQARAAVSEAAAVFENHSIDLIYARPGQSLGAWRGELMSALDLGAPHLSLYELTIEERTAFGRRAARGELEPMADDGQADLYDLTQEVCAERGLLGYEISNHAVDPTFESRHNHIYWASGDWIGVGPGAHGRLTFGDLRRATTALRRPAEYVSGEANRRSVEILTPLETAREILSMGLRTRRGVDLTRLDQLGHACPSDALSDAESHGWIHRDGGKITLTNQARLLADRVTAMLSP